MLHAQPFYEPDYLSYLELARRVQALVSTPRARIEHQVVITREPSDTQLAWEQLIEEISEAPGVRLRQRADGSMHISWFIERH